MTSTPPPPPPPPSGPPPGSSPVPAAAGAGGGYPVVLDFQRDYKVQNWRSLVNGILAIPHFIVLYVLGIASAVLWIVSFFTILFTKRNPFVNFQTMVLRYGWRVTSFAFFMRNEYPPFDFATAPGENVPDAAVFEVADPGDMSRLLIFVKWLMVIPHLFVLWFLGIGVLFAWIGAFFAVLFTGAWPEGLRKFVIGYERWSLRISAYVFFLTDEYPPFSLD
ncbi:MAG: DUF4389 domain-containing protein [Acidimicrobiia bacterium]